MKILYTKLVVLPRNIDFARDKDFFASKYAFLFQFAFRLFFFAFDVLFLGTAIIINKDKLANCYLL